MNDFDISPGYEIRYRQRIAEFEAEVAVYKRALELACQDIALGKLPLPTTIFGDYVGDYMERARKEMAEDGSS